MVELRPQNRTLTGALPRDRPSAARAHRVYVATTNHCNRACPWCSTCSSPRGQTWLSLADYLACFPGAGLFEVQLEGGEPTLHPQLLEFVDLARAEPRCVRVVIVTNGVVVPRAPEQLRGWLARLGAPLTIKLSINHHLLAQDRELLTLAADIRAALRELGDERELVLNVRLRRDAPGEDAWVIEAVREAGLIELANVFHLQAYGFAAEREGWDAPFVVGTNFTLVNPDGETHGPDLVGRSEAMRVLP
ncbi:molybdenum cofactor biosynthesis protein A [Enhygromyxa salina]|uniref:Molybdenum cofactor biosynthesis protein A n=1 Tax=Enhygromyxa salina TaxID=215803 RepID=A0A2S9XK96_9BACT|nr:radical SAM protein [Enhygromyxa salina]PRP93308.1 molybdenum cofactor biosynthesis protein A [Enhygromyxa salina]